MYPYQEKLNQAPLHSFLAYVFQCPFSISSDNVDKKNEREKTWLVVEGFR